MSAQVVAMHEGGILVYVGIQEFPGEFQEILETLNSEPVLGGVALHVEISAFDDPRAESHPVEKIQELMEERR